MADRQNADAGRSGAQTAIADAYEDLGENTTSDGDPLSLHSYYVDVDDTLDAAGTEIEQ